jgi:hypothetical protein
MALWLQIVIGIVVGGVVLYLLRQIDIILGFLIDRFWR